MSSLLPVKNNGKLSKNVELMKNIKTLSVHPSVFILFLENLPQILGDYGAEIH